MKLRLIINGLTKKGAAFILQAMFLLRLGVLPTKVTKITGVGKERLENMIYKTVSKK